LPTEDTTSEADSSGLDEVADRQVHPNLTGKNHFGSRQSPDIAVLPLESSAIVSAFAARRMR
jgi:hypothetical protein